ncbi:MAG: GntR family transcriptional regulator [Firmicutes bacterium]|nr:GntR family transcriptional regulator [Bacillota bacterium]
MATSISHRALKEIILERLRQEIVAGLYESGTHLVEQSLACQYGVSRGPVREALAQLEQEGLVSIQPRRGTVVTELSLTEAWEIYTLRGHLEQLGVRFARDHWSAVQNAQLAALISEMERLGPNDWLPAAQLDQQFHGVIVGASQNRTLIQTYQAMDSKVLAGFLAVRRHLAQVPGAMAGKHRPLAEALAEADFFRAEILAMEHWSDTAYRFRSLTKTENGEGT